MTSSPANANLPLAGRTLGHYRVVEEIGHGGMGRVYLAEDTNLDRRVALKVLAAEIAGDRAALRRLEQEAKLLAALDHPNIAMVHSLEEADGLRFFTMELVPGRTLDELLSAGPMPADAALGLGRQIASALEAAHGRGVVHRDLKPSNIRVTPDDRIKVLDFGLAREIRPASGDSSSEDTEPRGGFAGTPGYMSPEQLRQLPTDERTDVWGVGCVLWECLTGRPAFSGPTRADRLVATLEREPDASALPDETGPELRALLRRCLAKDPADRPATMREVRREIEEEIARRRYGAVPERVEEEPPCCPHNLPRRLDTFVGRTREVREIGHRLEETALLTLTGAGGCGKSRLAIEIAWEHMRSFPGGVWLVELAPLGDPTRVPHAVARAVGCPEVPQGTIEEALVRFLQGRKVLLVLDNCEHLLRSAATLAETLIRSCDELTILATSREALGIAGETRFHVPSLAVPATAGAAPAAALEGVESVRLFTERARAGRSDFVVGDDNAEAVAQICRRLDGIPLALELAAARVRTMTVAEIAQRLDDRFSLLTEGSRTSLVRHGTLRALIDWSWDLLEPAERVLLPRLSVFAGGWTLDAVERVCAGPRVPEWNVVDAHSRLVEKSLVEMTADGPGETGRSRYRMLETVRQYARELADPADRAEVRKRHRDYYLALAEEAEPLLRGAEQTRWLARLGLEHENLRVAFTTCAGAGDAELAFRLAGALGRYWMVRGHWTEGAELCAEALALGDDATDARAKTLNAAGNLAFHLGRYEEARAYHTAALETRRALGNRHDEAMSLNNLGEVARLGGDYALARDYYVQAKEIQEEIDDRWGLAVSLNNLGELAQSQGDYEEARSYHERACAFWPELGDRWGLAFSLSNLGFVATKRRRFDEARECYGRALSLARELGDRYKIALLLRQLGEAALEQRDWADAATSLRESLDLRKELGDREGIADSLESCAELFAARSDPARAARLLGAAEALRERIRAPAPAGRREDLERLADGIEGALGAREQAAARRRGRDLSLEDAVTVAHEGLARQPSSSASRPPGQPAGG